MVDAISPHSQSNTADISLPLRLDNRLKAGALNNDDFSIDCLFTLALEQGNPDSEAAASFIFDLYTGNKSVLDEQITQTSQIDKNLRLQLAIDASKLCALVAEMKGGQITVPPKILLIAGFEAADGSEEREKVLDQLRVNTHFCQKMAQTEQPLNSTLFSADRYISNDELNAVAARLNQPGSLTTFHPARSVSLERDELIKQFSQQRQHVDAVPLLVGEHWVLWVMFTNKNGERASLFFDSLAAMSEQTKSNLDGLAQACNMKTPVWVRANLQDNAPNGCAVFLMYAMQNIENLPHAPLHALKKVIGDFSKLDEDSQKFTIQHGRAEMLGALADDRSLADMETYV